MNTLLTIATFLFVAYILTELSEHIEKNRRKKNQAKWQEYQKGLERIEWYKAEFEKRAKQNEKSR